jgi:hypothetical protein
LLVLLLLLRIFYSPMTSFSQRRSTTCCHIQDSPLLLLLSIHNHIPRITFEPLTLYVVPYP